MASLVKDPRRGTWQVQWFDGTRWTRTTVVRKRPGWTPARGMPVKPPPEAQNALAEYSKRERLARARGAGYSATLPVRDFLDDYRENYLIGRPASSVEELDKAIAVFAGWCDERKITTIDAVTAEACHRWMADRARTKARITKQPLAHATLKKERALLAAAWAAALKQGRALLNPWLTVEVPGKPSGKQRKSWTPEEYQKLMGSSAPWLRDLLTIGCHCGLRIQALRLLEWRDVQWNRDPEKEGFGFLVVRPELDKAHKGYKVPIHPLVHDVLARREVHRLPGAEFVLTGLKGRPLTTTAATHRAIVSACRRAGLERPNSPNHHMRRTFGRWAVFGHLTGTPVPLYIVSRWMGHSAVKMTETYLDIHHEDSTGWMLGGGPAQAEGQASRGQDPPST